MRGLAAVALASVSALALMLGGACGSQPAGGAAGDAGAEANDDTEAGEASGPAPYPAYPFDLPQVKDLGGPKLTHANVVAFFDPSDTRKPAVMAYLNALGASDLWKASTAEYGVGPLGSITAVDLVSKVPTSITSTDLQSFVGDLVRDYAFGTPDGGTDDAGANDGEALEAGPPDSGSGVHTFHTDAVYVLFLPNGTNVSDDSCSNDDGYHESVSATPTDDVAFAVVKSCPASIGADEAATRIVTHELVEATTDPFALIKPALLGVDDPWLPWGYHGFTELGDLCEGDKVLVDAPASRKAQAFWSNAAAAAGRYPCSPTAKTTALFQAIPGLTDPQKYISTVKVRGISLAVDEAAFVDLHIASDRALPGPLALSVRDEATFFGRSPELQLDLDSKTAVNGDVVRLTVTRLRAPPTGVTVLGSVFAVFATDPSTGATFPDYGFVALKK
jgi:hypothetical protein